MAHPAALVAVGDQESKKSEKFENDIWSDIEDPPIDNTRLWLYGVTFYDGNYYYFGGFGNRQILCLNGTSWTWSNPGQLNSPRINLGVISVGNIFMVVGGQTIGQPTKNNEACILENGNITCTELSTSLSGYRSPILFLVDENIRNC